MTLKPLNPTNVEKVNSAWPHRFEGSEKFVLYSIVNHLSIGLFDENDELLAWTLMYDSGGLGMVQVVESHQRKGYGSLVSRNLSRKIAEEFDLDVMATIVETNEKSLKMFTKFGFKPTTKHFWIVMINQ